MKLHVAFRRKVLYICVIMTDSITLKNQTTGEDHTFTRDENGIITVPNGPWLGNNIEIPGKCRFIGTDPTTFTNCWYDGSNDQVASGSK